MSRAEEKWDDGTTQTKGFAVLGEEALLLQPLLERWRYGWLKKSCKWNSFFPCPTGFSRSFVAVSGC